MKTIQLTFSDKVKILGDWNIVITDREGKVLTNTIIPEGLILGDGETFTLPFNDGEILPLNNKP